MTLLSAATDGLRADGRLGHLTYVLVIQGIVAARLTRLGRSNPSCRGGEVAGD